jgi:AcrR family transcriptional regulator
VVPRGNKKVDLIKATYTLLSNHAPQNLSVRTIAAEAGCTTGAVYRHFESVDHLILVASVRFLEDYMADLNDILQNDDDPLGQHIEMWRSFGRQAFAHVDVFEMMFWGVSEDQLGDAIFAYYQEFPDSFRKLSGFQVMLFLSSSLRERNLLTLNRCMAELAISEETAAMLNDVEICSFRGLMSAYRDCYRESGKADEALSRYMEMLTFMLDAVKLGRVKSKADELLFPAHENGKPTVGS